MTLFFKFISLFKLIKFSILQLFFFPLTAIIFLIIMKASSIYTPLMNTLNNNDNPGTLSVLNTPISNNKEVLISPETMFFVENVPIPSSESIFIPSNDLPYPAAPTIPGRSPIQNTPNSNVLSDINNINSPGGLQYEPLEVLDPTLDLFQKELNSETCVERIACKIAATGKTGIMPLWINWILHQASKPVLNDKLLNYLKAYGDVIDEIQTKSPSPDNWETWCFERYDCSDTDHYR